LESAGHSATHALQSFPPGTADNLLFAHVQQLKAIFVSTDPLAAPLASAFQSARLQEL
jgi:hypothetical protein